MDFSDNKKGMKVLNNNNDNNEFDENYNKRNYTRNRKNDEIRIGSNLTANNDVLQLPSVLHNQIRIIRTNDSCFKDYVVLNNLGKGTYAQVWKVKHKITNEIFAAKLLQPNQFPKESFNRIVEMFTKEIINLSICQCPGVIKLHKVIGGKEGWILIQDYANDGTLWKENLSSNMSEAFLYFIQLLQGMWYIQDMNIVHRDLKPTNILRYDNKRIVIADFGWSEHIDSCNLHPTEWPGTLEINPPEVLRNTGPMTEKIDNYALGMNMILFISGRFVCRQKGIECSKVAQTILKTVHNLRHSKPPSRFRENLKAWDLFVKLTSSNPSERLSLQNVLDHPWVTEMLNNFSLQNSKFLWHEKVKSRWIYLLSNNWNFFKNISSISNGKINKINELTKEDISISKVNKNKATVVMDADCQKDKDSKYYSSSCLKDDYEILYYMMKNNFKNRINCCSVKKNDNTNCKSNESKEKHNREDQSATMHDTNSGSSSHRCGYRCNHNNVNGNRNVNGAKGIDEKDGILHTEGVNKEIFVINDNFENDKDMFGKKEKEQIIKNQNGAIIINDDDEAIVNENCIKKKKNGNILSNKKEQTNNKNLRGMSGKSGIYDKTENNNEYNEEDKRDAECGEELELAYEVEADERRKEDELDREEEEDFEEEDCEDEDCEDEDCEDEDGDDEDCEDEDGDDEDCEDEDSDDEDDDDEHDDDDNGNKSNKEEHNNDRSLFPKDTHITFIENDKSAHNQKNNDIKNSTHKCYSTNETYEFVNYNKKKNIHRFEVSEGSSNLLKNDIPNETNKKETNHNNGHTIFSKKEQNIAKNKTEEEVESCQMCKNVFDNKISKMLSEEKELEEKGKYEPSADKMKRNFRDHIEDVFLNFRDSKNVHTMKGSTNSGLAEKMIDEIRVSNDNKEGGVIETNGASNISEDLMSKGKLQINGKTQMSLDNVHKMNRLNHGKGFIRKQSEQGNEENYEELVVGDEDVYEEGNVQDEQHMQQTQQTQEGNYNRIYTNNLNITSAGKNRKCVKKKDAFSNEIYSLLENSKELKKKLKKNLNNLHELSLKEIGGDNVGLYNTDEGGNHDQLMDTHGQQHVLRSSKRSNQFQINMNMGMNVGNNMGMNMGVNLGMNIDTNVDTNMDMDMTAQGEYRFKNSLENLEVSLKGKIGNGGEGKMKSVISKKKMEIRPENHTPYQKKTPSDSSLNKEVGSMDIRVIGTNISSEKILPKKKKISNSTFFDTKMNKGVGEIGESVVVLAASAERGNYDIEPAVMQTVGTSDHHHSIIPNKNKETLNCSSRLKSYLGKYDKDERSDNFYKGILKNCVKNRDRKNGITYTGEYPGCKNGELCEDSVKEENELPNFVIKKGYLFHDNLLNRKTKMNNDHANNYPCGGILSYANGNTDCEEKECIRLYMESKESDVASPYSVNKTVMSKDNNMKNDSVNLLSMGNNFSILNKMKMQNDSYLKFDMEELNTNMPEEFNCIYRNNMKKKNILSLDIKKNKSSKSYVGALNKNEKNENTGKYTLLSDKLNDINESHSDVNDDIINNFMSNTKGNNIEGNVSNISHDDTLRTGEKQIPTVVCDNNKMISPNLGHVITKDNPKDFYGTKKNTCVHRKDLLRKDNSVPSATKLGEAQRGSGVNPGKISHGSFHTANEKCICGYGCSCNCGHCTSGCNEKDASSDFLRLLKPFDNTSGDGKCRVGERSGNRDMMNPFSNDKERYEDMLLEDFFKNERLLKNKKLFKCIKNDINSVNLQLGNNLSNQHIFFHYNKDENKLIDQMKNDDTSSTHVHLGKNNYTNSGCSNNKKVNVFAYTNNVSNYAKSSVALDETIRENFTKTSSSSTYDYSDIDLHYTSNKDITVDSFNTEYKLTPRESNPSQRIRRQERQERQEKSITFAHKSGKLQIPH
ncbi:protein kinase domain containing protein [Plasmodium ovale curtisi]|uniref:Protein kinase domain containing protein n=1 Tax=Plasmodium ovale curtisi TaxID=864141 RepID=A0A1A8VXI6_PLAOA|nr:protein kinase domain containing protein [Plasmodium ovale curtisi]